MTSPVLRSALPSDAASIAGCVREAYSPYIKRIGKPPGPMLGNYDEIVRDHRVFVVDGGEEIIGVLVLIEEERGLLLDNIAVRPSRQAEESAAVLWSTQRLKAAGWATRTSICIPTSG